MNIVLVLIPITLILVTAGVLIFNWAVKSGQYDDLEGPAHRILYDDDQDMIPRDARQPKGQRPSKKNPQRTGQHKTAPTPSDDQDHPKA